MRVLVTGGAGYLGSTLVPMLLADGHEVRVLDDLRYGGGGLAGPWSHPGFALIQGDIRDPSRVREALTGVDGLVHLAAIVGDPACARLPREAVSINQEAAVALLGAAREAGVGRIVFASTCSNYGRMADPAALLDEDAELRPLSLYAETKVAVERAILADPALRATATILRFATLFGVSPRMRFDLTVNEFARDMLLRGELTVYGETFWRPYVHVRDAARAIALVLGSPGALVSGRVFNAGITAQNHTKAEIVALVQRHVPDARITRVPQAEDPRDYRVSFARFERELRFSGTRTVADAVAEVIAALRSGLFPADDPAYRN